MSDGSLDAVAAANGMPLHNYKLDAKKGHFMIGRNPDVDLTIDHDIISRKHVKFVFDNNKWFVSNIGKNEVRLGDYFALNIVHKEPPALLHDGDQLVIGPNQEYKFKVMLPGGSGGASGESGENDQGQTEATEANGSPSPLNLLRKKVKNLEKSDRNARDRIEELKDKLKKKIKARETAIEKIMRDNRLTQRRAEQQYLNTNPKAEEKVERLKDDIREEKERRSNIKKECEQASKELEAAEEIGHRADEKVKAAEAKAAIATKEMSAEIASKDCEIAQLRHQLEEMNRKRPAPEPDQSNDANGESPQFAIWSQAF